MLQLIAGFEHCLTHQLALQLINTACNSLCLLYLGDEPPDDVADTVVRPPDDTPCGLESVYESMRLLYYENKANARACAAVHGLSSDGCFGTYEG